MSCVIYIEATLVVRYNNCSLYAGCYGTHSNLPPTRCTCTCVLHCVYLFEARYSSILCNGYSIMCGRSSAARQDTIYRADLQWDVGEKPGVYTYTIAPSTCAQIVQPFDWLMCVYVYTMHLRGFGLTGVAPLFQDSSIRTPLSGHLFQDTSISIYIFIRTPHLYQDTSISTYLLGHLFQDTYKCIFIRTPLSGHLYQYIFIRTPLSRHFC